MLTIDISEMNILSIGAYSYGSDSSIVHRHPIGKCVARTLAGLAAFNVWRQI
jgi:hypothetical protein